MSYDMQFKAQVGNTNKKVSFGNDLNMTYNIRNILVESSQVEGWEANCELSVSYLKPFFKKGIEELLTNPSKYKQYEPANGWGSIDTVINFYKWFFEQIKDFEDDELHYLWLEVY